MTSKDLFVTMRYEIAEQSSERDVFVKYTDEDGDKPKYKRSCIKIILEHASRHVIILGRNEKGNLSRPTLGVREIEAIAQRFHELGWA